MLLFESDKAYSALLSEVLREQGFDVCVTTRPLQLADSLRRQDYRFCLLSLSSCEKDTLTLVREEQPSAVIIALAGEETDDIICRNYQLGINDFWRKSESVGLLVAKLKMWQSILEKDRLKQPLQLQIGEYYFDSVSRMLSLNGEHRKLTAKESELLLLLGRHQNQLVSRRQILRQIWREDNYFNARSLSVFIHRLRQYLKDDKHIQIICIAQKSYRLSVADETNEVVECL